MSALWWCWTENEPSNRNCIDRGHEIRQVEPGHVTTAEHRSHRDVAETELSTSARLREMTAKFHASQADLTRALAERDEARSCWSAAERELTTLRIQLAGVVQFASAYNGTERAWQLARQDVGPCGLCDQTIGRGHAAEPMPGAAGYFQHAAGLCPDKETT